MEISKMLTLSTSHVTDKTLKLLDTEASGNNFPCLGVYKKEEYGYFIYIDKDAFHKENGNPNSDMPGDLVTVIAFTLEAGCNILCLDCDGDELVCLPHYEYKSYSANDSNVSDELCYCGGVLICQKVTDYRVV